MKVLMISTDRNIFKENSAVRVRMIEYGKNYEELHIIIFIKNKFQIPNSKFQTNFKFQISKNIWVYPTNSFSRLLYVRDAIKIGREILCSEGYKLQATSCQITAQDPFECGLVGRRLSRKFKVPLELQIHTDLGSSYFTSLKLGWRLALLNFLRFQLARFLLPRADKIRVVSNRIKNFLTTNLKIAENKIEIRPIKVDEEKIRNTVVTPENDLRKKYPQFDFIALMAGRLEPEKNFALALDVWQEIVKKFPHAGLIIVGSGSLEKKLKLSARGGPASGRQANLIFEPWTENLSAYYKTSDLFLNTSLYEGYGMALVEAKATGLPIISTDVGVARELGCEIANFDNHDFTNKILVKIKR